MSSAEGNIANNSNPSEMLTEEHVNSALNKASVSAAGKSSPGNKDVSPIIPTTGGSSSPERKGTPPASSDMCIHLDMPGKHDLKRPPTVNQLIWFIDYMVAESSTFGNSDLPFDWPQEITHCFNGRQYIISELVREYFSDQIKQAKKAGSDMGASSVETDGNCFVKVVNEEERTYEKISILVNYSRSGQPNRLEVLYDEVEQPYKTPEEIRAEIRRQKTFSLFDTKRNEALKRQNKEKLAANLQEIEQYHKNRNEMPVSIFHLNISLTYPSVRLQNICICEQIFH